MSRMYLLIYLCVVGLLVSLALFIPDLSDSSMMFIFGVIVIVTSIFTYSTRRKQ